MTHTAQKFTVGDRVQYRAAWLRSVGAFTGPLPFAKGTITKITGTPGGSMLASITWSGYTEELAAKVNTFNLEAIR